ncbi:hypothetical protein ABPG74_005226 [Tetrahymena malaccensis]
MDSLCSPLNSFELLTPLLGNVKNQIKQKNVNPKENMIKLQPFTSKEVSVQLFSFLNKDGFSKFQIIEQSVNYLLISCSSVKQDKKVFLTVLRTTQEENQFICQKYQKIIGQGYMNILKYSDVIYYKQMFTTIIVSQIFEKTLQQEIEYRQLSEKLFTYEQFNQIIIQLFISISEIHQRGVYHQNINLSKIAITEDNQYMLYDFNFPLSIRHHIKNSTCGINLSTNHSRQILQEKDNKQLEFSDIQQVLKILLQILQFQNKVIEKQQNRQQNFYKDLQLLLENNQCDYQNINPAQSKNSLTILNEILPLLNLTQVNYQMLKDMVNKTSQKQFQIKSYDKKQIEIDKLNLFITKSQFNNNTKQIIKAYKLLLQNEQSDILSFLQINLEYLQYLFKHKAYKSSKMINQLINVSKIYDELGQFQKALQYSQEALSYSLERYKDNHYIIVNSYIKVSKSFLMFKEYQKSEEAINKGLQIYSKLSRGYKKVNKKDLYQIINDLDIIEDQIIDV